MLLAQRMICFWPGLPRLWYRGEWRGLRAALIFAVVLNMALATSVIWSWRFAPIVPRVLWGVVGAWMLIAGLRDWRQFPSFLMEKGKIDQDLFLLAQAEYLRGDWCAAESALEQLLRWTPQDVDARLLLAGVLRRTGRFDQARKQLRRLARTGSAKWGEEIGREAALIDREQAQGKVAPGKAMSEQAATPVKEAGPDSRQDGVAHHEDRDEERDKDELNREAWDDERWVA